MKKTAILVILTILMLLPATCPLWAADTSSGASPGYAYDSGVVYSGPFNTNGIYHNNRNNPKWYPGLNQELDAVICRAARESFSRTGRWSGNFDSDSSCLNTSEPIEYAVGNWLNFVTANK